MEFNHINRRRGEIDPKLSVTFLVEPIVARHTILPAIVQQLRLGGIASSSTKIANREYDQFMRGVTPFMIAVRSGEREQFHRAIQNYFRIAREQVFQQLDAGNANPSLCVLPNGNIKVLIPVMQPFADTFIQDYMYGARHVQLENGVSFLKYAYEIRRQFPPRGILMTNWKFYPDRDTISREAIFKLTGPLHHVTNEIVKIVQRLKRVFYRMYPFERLYLHNFYLGENRRNKFSFIPNFNNELSLAAQENIERPISIRTLILQHCFLPELRETQFMAEEAKQLYRANCAEQRRMRGMFSVEVIRNLFTFDNRAQLTEEFTISPYLASIRNLFKRDLSYKIDDDAILYISSLFIGDLISFEEVSTEHNRKPRPSIVPIDLTDQLSPF